MKIQIPTKRSSKIIAINRRKAIRERCLNCSEWSHHQITNCEFSDCNLHPFRMAKGKQDPKKRTKAVRQYCLWCVNGQYREIRKCTATDCPLFPYRKWKIDRSVGIDAETLKSSYRAV